VRSSLRVSAQRAGLSSASSTQTKDAPASTHCSPAAHVGARGLRTGRHIVTAPSLTVADERDRRAAVRAGRLLGVPADLF